ncbi:MAG: hypothetical protein INF75_14960 [Roseomonas sp.]|nr:hypothetical protein [Roseomonas sp.]MCA3327403.1 hypothetical protein [Roseomonas sp.]MCA3330625.1 hypothetical protein [Roseomonas sp.]MCA3333213.1 hypothetical protein [Roseomonas sp.]MCA3347233.1 hypothetical protein [Roseomonas sp.]
MIRPLTFVSLIIAAGAGLHLYQVKHSVSMLDRELREVNRQTEVVRERTQILRAEWALLNEPDRLRQVAQRHLALEPMAPAQFIREAELERRLPAARVFAGPPSLFGPPEMPVSVPEVLMVPSSVATIPPATPPAIARVEPLPRQAPVEPPPRLSVAPAQPLTPRPAPPPAPTIANSVLHVPPAVPAPPAMVASALGGVSGALPPPVPLQRPVPVGAPQGATR